jgi:cyclic pyranopterin phosphate synthase
MTQPRDQLGRPLHDLRISLTDQCNLRCTYCMPAEVFGPDHIFLKKSQMLTFEEIERLVRVFVQCGVSKIRLTGGEPLLRKDVPELVQRLQGVGGVEDLALTTNALLLPKYAVPLKAAGLDRVNVSLDAVDPAVFRELSGGRGTVSRVIRGIQSALGAGLGVKINMVVEKGINESEILPMAEAAREWGVTLRFIEFMDVGNVNHWDREKVYPARAILKQVQSRWELDPVVPAYRGEVARRYRYRDGAGEIGIISSVTQPFCQNCSRARLSADGHFFTCLFASTGVPLRPALRGEAPFGAPLEEADLLGWVRDIWNRREDRYSELRNELLKQETHSPKIEMSYIGG